MNLIIVILKVSVIYLRGIQECVYVCVCVCQQTSLLRDYLSTHSLALNHSANRKITSLKLIAVIFLCFLLLVELHSLVASNGNSLRVGDMSHTSLDGLVD